MVDKIKIYLIHKGEFDEWYQKEVRKLKTLRNDYVEILKKSEVMKEIEKTHNILTGKLLEIRDKNRPKWDGREDAGIITGIVISQDELKELKKRLET